MDRKLISKELDINRVVFIGRTFDEYRTYALTDLKKSQTTL